MPTRYLYLESQAIWALIFIILILISIHNRKTILKSAMATIPLAFIQGVYHGVWEPKRIADLPVGIEDFLFCFLMGGISIALVCLITKNKNQDFPNKLNFKRTSLVAIIGITLITGLYLSGIKSYLNNYISMAIISGIIIIHRRKLWITFLTGSISVTILYTLALQPAFLIWPDLPELWVEGALSGITIGKAPFEEAIWAFLFGGTWPTIMFYITGTEKTED